MKPGQLCSSLSCPSCTKEHRCFLHRAFRRSVRTNCYLVAASANLRQWGWPPPRPPGLRLAPPVLRQWGWPPLRLPCLHLAPPVLLHRRVYFQLLSCWILLSALKKPLSVVELELLDSPESSDLLEPLELLSLDVGIQADPINGWLSTLRSD